MNDASQTMIIGQRTETYLSGPGKRCHNVAKMTSTGFAVTHLLPAATMNVQSKYDMSPSKRPRSWRRPPFVKFFAESMWTS